MSKHHPECLARLTPAFHPHGRAWSHLGTCTCDLWARIEELEARIERARLKATTIGVTVDDILAALGGDPDEQ